MIKAKETIYVYLIQAGKKKGSPVKVGYSKNPEARLKQLQTGNHESLNLIMKIKCGGYDHARRLELDMHRILGGQNVHLEWYRMNKTQVMKILNQMAGDKDIDVVETVDNLSDRAVTEQKPSNKNRNLLKQIELLEKSLARRKREAGIMYGFIYDNLGQSTNDTKKLFKEIA